MWWVAIGAGVLRVLITRGGVEGAVDGMGWMMMLGRASGGCDIEEGWWRSLLSGVDRMRVAS